MNLTEPQLRTLERLSPIWSKEEHFDGRTLAALERRELIERKDGLVRTLQTKSTTVSDYKDHPDYDKGVQLAEELRRATGETHYIFVEEQKFGTDVALVFFVTRSDHNFTNEPIYTTK